MEKIANNVYVEIGFAGCNPGFVVTREGVVMIDTPQIPTDAIKWRDEIAKHGPVRYLINSEPHGDHFSGNYFFEGTVVAHEGTREAILAASVGQLEERLQQMSPESLAHMEGFHFRPPTITLSQRLTLYLGHHTFQLINMPGHSPFQLAIYIPEERVVFTSDNVFHKVPAALHQALPHEWLESLERLGGLDADVLVPGHGTVCDRSYIPEMRANIQRWIDAVSAAIGRGMTLEEAEEKLSPIDLYAENEEDPARTKMFQNMNLARLYQVLKGRT